MKLIKKIIGYIILILALIAFGCVYPIMFIFYTIGIGLKLTGKLN